MSVGALLWVLDHAPCPSSSAFAVLVVYANFANEDGRSYPAASTVAAKTRQNIKTVRAAIDALVDGGLLVPTGRKVGMTGNIPVYALGMETIPKVGSLRGERVQDAPAASQDAATVEHEQACPDMGSFAETSNLPESGPKPTRIRVGEPVLEPVPLENADAFSAPRGAGKNAVGFSDWQVPAIESLPDRLQAIVRQWPPGSYASHGNGHRDWMVGQGRRPRNADALWHARIVQLGATPLRDAKAGLTLVSSAGHPPADAIRLIAAEERVSLYRRMRRDDDAAVAQRDVDTIRARIAAGGG